MVKVTAKKKPIVESEPSESESIETPDPIFALSHIDWENMYAYEKGSVQLSDLTIISGARNGDGKTTIPQALCYAMTGSILGSASIDTVKRSGSETLLAQVRGIWDGERAVIVRKLTDGKESIEIMRGKDEKIIKGISANKELEEIVTLNDFERLIYINGHNIESLMNDSMVTRSKTLDRLLNIDVFTTTVTKFSSIIASLEKEIVECNYHLSQKQTEINSLQKIIKDLPSKDALTKKVEEFTTRREKILGEVVKIREQIASLSSKKSETITYKKKIETLQQQLTTSKNMKAQYVETSDRVTTQMEKINTTIATKFAVETVEDAIENIESQIERIEATIASLREKVSKMKPLQAIQQQILVEKTGSQCPICDQTFDRDKIIAIIETESSELDHLITAIKDHTTKIAMLRKNELHELMQYQSQMKVLMQQLNVSRTKIVEYTKNIDIIQTQLSKIAAPSDIDESTYQELRMIEVEKERDQQNLLLFIDEINKQMKIVDGIEETRTLIVTLQNESENLQLRIEKLERQQTYAKQLHHGIQNILVNLRKEMIDRINPIVADWIQTFAPYVAASLPAFEFALQLEEVHTAKKEHVEYSTIAKSGGKLVAYESLSTGQRAICAIALILAIADLAHHRLGLLVFDEIQTSGVDDIALNKLLDIIVMITKNQTKVIMIDRRDDIIKSLYERAAKEKIDLIHYEAKRTDGISMIRRVYPA